jgi:hypothetical protein
MRTRICQRFEWMRPYLNIGTKFIRPHKIARIGAWSPGGRYGSKEFAAIFQDADGKPHRIWINTHYDGDSGVTPFSRIDLLKLLAHELAHTMDWKHTPFHEDLSAKITRAFMAQLRRDGYISEEEEMGENVS